MAIHQNSVKCTICEKRSTCFNELGNMDPDLLLSNRLEIKFRKGEIICKQGTFASNISYIYSGLAKAYLETETGKHVIINVIPEGQMIALPALFSHKTYPYSAAALEDCILCALDIHVIEEYMRSNGSYASGIIRILNNYTLNNYNRYLSITQKNMDGRLADLLIYLSEKVYNKHKFHLSLSRTDMAELTHMSPESITRILAGFKKSRLIRISDKELEIKNLKKLKTLGYHA